MNTANTTTPDDDTTVSVSMTMDNWVPITAVLICCGIAACLVVNCFTTTSSTTQSACHTAALVLAGALLVLLAVACYNRMRAPPPAGKVCAGGDCESFADFEWGDDGFVHKSWKADKRTQKVVGPDPTGTALYNWQYNPQNSLTDYRYYATREGESPERIAPIARPRVGTYSGLPNVDAADQLGAVSTRVPDANSCADKYVLQHPASPIPFQTAPVPYEAM